MQERVGAARPAGRGRQGKQSGWPAKEGLRVGWAGAPLCPGLTACTGAAISRWTQTPGQSKPMCEAMKRPAQELGLLSLSWGRKAVVIFHPSHGGGGHDGHPVPS